MSTQSNRKDSSTSKSKRGNGSSSSNGVRKNTPETYEHRPLIGSRLKNDLAGLAIAILAVVIIVILLLPSNAIGAQFISEGLHLMFGRGALILPILMLCWSITFFVRKRLTNSPIRLAIGLGVIFLAVIAIFAVMTPQAAIDPGRIFVLAMLTKQGGYLGGALAWILLTLVGEVPTIIVLIGLILVGLVLIGLSITGLVEWIILKIKGEGRRKNERPLPGKLTELGDAAVANSGSAYQMGPQPLGNSAGANRRHSAGSEAKRKSVDAENTSDAAQFESTLLRPSRGFINDKTHPDIQENGATRRKTFIDEAIEDIDSLSQTMILDVGDLNWDASAHGEERERPQTNARVGDTTIMPADTSVLSTDDVIMPEDVTVLLTHNKKETSKKKKGKKSSNQGDANNSYLFGRTTYSLPNMKLLRVSREKATTKAGVSELRATAERLQETLEEFRVDGEVVGWIAGPTVTLYKISLGEGVRLNRITALQSDIQLALAAQAIRIVAPIPGTSLVGIEIPNAARNEVLLGDVLDTARDSALALAIGKDVEGEAICADLASMPHLLIGGTTGSGKSVAINAIIMSLLMRTTPEEVRLIMIDPKRVELTLYNGIPHLYVPVVTDAGQAASALAWCVAEMDRRLKIFEKHGVKNIRQFNTRATENIEKLEQEQRRAADAPVSGKESTIADDALSDTTTSDSTAATVLMNTQSNEQSEVDITVEQENLRATMPYLVIVIDELADLMMLNGKEVEGAISRLAQLARAAGLHLVVATQRPSTNVITGLIKANIVNRIAFTVASSIDSRVILDTPGAEDLIGLGDMLFSRPEYSKPIRIQGCFVSESEIETVVEYWRGQGDTDYHEEILLGASGSGSNAGGFSGDDSIDDDPLLWDAAEIVVAGQLGSTSTLQRRLKVGYARAGRIMDMLEMKGIVGPPNGSKPREVLVDDVLDLETLRAYG